MECNGCGSRTFLARITEDATTVECSGCGTEIDRRTHEGLRADERETWGASERFTAA